MKSRFSIFILFFIFLLTDLSRAQNLFFHLLPLTSVQPYTWTGLAGDNNWNTSGNWSTNAVPGASDTAKFRGSACSGGQCNSTINANISVAGVDIDSAYGGTITQGAGRTITVGTSGWLQAGGDFAGGNSAITFNTSSLSLSGGTYTATSGTTTFNFNSTVSFSSGTFNHNNGSVVFDSQEFGYQLSKTYTFNVTAPAMTFYNLTVRGRSDYEWAYFNLSVPSGQNLIVENDFNFGTTATYGAVCLVGGGTVQVKGNLVVPFSTCTNADNNGQFVFNGTGAQTYSWNSGSYVKNPFISPQMPTLPPVVINKVSGTLSPAAGTTDWIVQSFTLTAGTFNAPTGTMRTRTNFTVAGGTFNHNSGTLGFDQSQSGYANTTNYAVSIPGSNFSLGSLLISGGSEYDPRNFTLVIPAGVTLDLSGDLTMQNTFGGTSGVYSNGGTINVGGHISMATGANGGTTVININGSGAESLSQVVGTKFPSATLTINKSAGTATATSHISLSTVGQNLTISAGTLDLAGKNLSVNGTLTVASGAILLCNGGTLSYGSLVNNGVIDCLGGGHSWTGLAGNGNWNTPGNWSGNAVPGASDTAVFGSSCLGAACNATVDAAISVKGVSVLSSYSGTITQGAGQTISVGTSGWTQSGGVFSGSASNINIYGSLNLNSGTFTSTSGTLMIQRNFIVSGGTVNANAGTISFGDGISNLTATITPGAFAYNNITFTGWASGFTLTGTLTVNGLLLLADNYSSPGGLSGGTILANGNVTTGGHGYAGTTLLKIAGSGNQLITGIAAAAFPNFEIASTGGTVTYSGSLYFNRNYTYTSGTVNTSTSTVYFAYSDSSGVTYSITPGAFDYYNVTFGGYNATINLNSSTMTVNGTLTIADGYGGALNSGTLLAKGNLVASAYGYNGSVLIRLNGLGNQSVTGTAIASIPKFEIASTGGTVTYSGTLLFVNDYTYTSGTVDTSTSTVRFGSSSWPGSIVPGPFTYNNVTFYTWNSSYNLNAGTMTINGNLNLGDTYSGGSGINNGNLIVNGNVFYNDYGYNGTAAITFGGSNSSTLTVGAIASRMTGPVTINKTGGTSVTLVSNAPYSAGGQDLTINDGTLDLSGYTLNVADVLTVSASGTLICNGGTYTHTTLVNSGTIDCAGYAYNWVGGSGTNWNTAANWQGGVVPGAGQIAVFKDTYCGANCNATVNVDPNVLGIRLTSGYTGTITQSPGIAMTVGNSGWSQAGGIFIGNNSNITIDLSPSSGKFSLTGGTFTSTSGILQIGLNNGSGYPSRNVLQIGSSATFNHNNGTLKMKCDDNWTGNRDYSMDVGTSLSVYNFISDALGQYGNGHTILPGQKIVVLNDLQVTSGQIRYGGNYEVYGNITLFYPGTNYGDFATITMKGTANQTYAAGNSNTGVPPALIIDKTAGTVTAASADFRIAKLSIVQGTFSAPTGTLTVGYYVDNYPSLWGSTTLFSTHSPAAFLHSNGTVHFKGVDYYFGNSTYTIQANGTLNLNNVLVTGYTSNTGHTIYAGDKIVVGGSFTHNSGWLNGDWELQGDAAFNSTSVGAATVKFSGGKFQNISGGFPTTGQWTVDKSAGSAILANNFNLNGAGQSVSVVNGTLDMAGFNLTVNGNVTNSATIIGGPPTCGTLSFGGSYSGNALTCSAYIPFALVPAFGATSGKTIVNFSGGVQNEYARGLVVQSDGKLLTSGLYKYSNGDAKFLLSRFNSDGTSDATFGSGGYQIVTVEISGDSHYYDFGYGLLLQSDGQIIMYGDSNNKSPSWNDDLALARLNPDGTYDNTFSGDGRLQVDFGGDNTSGTGTTLAALQSDGKIINCGSSSGSGFGDSILLRLNTNGTLDTAFDTDGKLTLDLANTLGGSTGADNCQAITVQNYGNGASEKNIFAGSFSNGANTDIYVGRLESNGSIDTTFGTSGYWTFNGGSNESISSVVVDSSQKVYVVGSTSNGTNTDFLVFRLNSDGTPDTGFGVNGKMQFDFGGSQDEARQISVLTTGQILVGGTTNITGNQDLGFVLLDSSGNRVTNFKNSSGYATIDVAGAQQTDSFGDMVVNASDEVTISGSVPTGAYTSSFILKFKVGN